MVTVQRRGTGDISFYSVKPEGKKQEEEQEVWPNVIWQVPFHLFRPTDNIASPLLEFLLER
jgi:hypothetical protein